MPPGCAEGGGEMQDLVNQSADVQKEDNMEFLKSNLATRRRKESNLPWPFKWPCPKKGPWPMPPGCAEGGGEMHDLVNQSADVQNEDKVKLSWAPWPCPKKGPWPAPPLCGEGRIEIQYDVNQSEFEQRENNVKSSWAPWPCPKKGPWPMPPGCAEGGGEMQDLVNQSADVQKEDNMEFLKYNLATRRRKESNLPWPFKWPCPKKGLWPMPPGCAEGGGEIQDLVNQSADVQKEDNVKLSWLQKVKLGKACVDASVKVGIKVGGKICVR